MVYDYETFKKHIFDLTRIDLNAYKERQMKRRIDALIAKHKIATYEEYVAAIKKDKLLFDEFVNYLTINVSEFYRNPDQWALLEKEIFPYLFDRFGNNLKIWSAACSTGDEPYSLVMLLSKMLPLHNIKIIATDIDKQVLEKAQSGLYHEKSLKALPEEFKKKHFNMINDKTFAISDAVKSRVEFRQHNLLKDDYPKDCDMIVCRNVLIYFTEEAKVDIYQKFHMALKKEGILFVGSTEQILQPNKLGYESYRSFFYKKMK
ncbi:CheR family methyltransferase [Anaeromicropila populeti]|uniref:protein-glutamate O-methyltransferase n=1 Tax=Anaeromicropila populeti TaxID=37658 RepID=A0A1I6KGC4_9FIRM|nr:chemotaxis protein methyltransferase CheR [Anaeromicropila populeti]